MLQKIRKRSDSLLRLLHLPEYFFAVVSLTFGFALALIVPIGGNSDEAAHYFRVQQVARFGVIASQDDIVNGMRIDRGRAGLVNQENYPFTLRKDTSSVKSNTLELRYKTGELVREKGFISAAVYSPVVYAPQVAGVWLGKILQLPLNSEAIVMRVLGVIAQAIIIFIAIKILPRGKWFLAIFALLPVMVVQSAAISADAMTNAIAILFISLIFSLAVKKRDHTHMLWAIGTVSTVLALVKAPYFLLILLLPAVLIVNQSLRNKKSAVAIAAITAASLCIAVAWTMAVSNVPIWSPEGVDAAGQVKHALSTPITPIMAFLNSILVGMQDFSRHATLMGMFLWDSTPLSPYFMVISVAMVTVAVFARDTREVSARAWERVWRLRWWMVAFAGAAAAAVSGILYLKYTRIGAGNINGVQGRYFLPLVPLAVIPFITNANSVKKTGLCLASIACLIATVWTILSRIAFV